MQNVVRLRPNNLKQAQETSYYRFTEADPVMDTVANAITEAGWSVGKVVKAVYDISDGAVSLHYQTVERWLDGRTRRPQHFNVLWVMRALGYEERWVKQESEDGRSKAKA